MLLHAHPRNVFLPALPQVSGDPHTLSPERQVCNLLGKQNRFASGCLVCLLFPGH